MLNVELNSLKGTPSQYKYFWVLCYSWEQGSAYLVVKDQNSGRSAMLGMTRLKEFLSDTTSGIPVIGYTISFPVEHSI